MCYCFFIANLFVQYIATIARTVRHIDASILMFIKAFIILFKRIVIRLWAIKVMVKLMEHFIDEY